MACMLNAKFVYIYMVLWVKSSGPVEFNGLHILV